MFKDTALPMLVEAGDPATPEALNARTVEAHCRDAGMEYEWTDRGLRTAFSGRGC